MAESLWYRFGDDMGRTDTLTHRQQREALGLFGHGMSMVIHLLGVVFAYLIRKRWVGVIHVLCFLFSFICACWHYVDLRDDSEDTR